ncbi:GumC domain-containing protein [Parapedobacter koreensis]|uniref:LPS O-antigen chain length determinant protein, WzzB/FepE family n=1 Tax=Parapedobacter koreensis TaxID=332977 RepID=A0A1H7T9E1_9SPHI|nr:hypothetical protein [Parapedobacter koreensis]SEL80457.1 LPS O-antigen chain length determinant protein, WzzB/FepE family [Parapedobacter koreensis]
MRSINKHISSFVKESKDNEAIRLKSVFQVFFVAKWSIVGIIVFMFIIGLIRGLTSPNEYTTNSKVITEQNDQTGRGGLNNLASLAGLNTRNLMQPETLSPDLYPSIVTNADFVLQLASEQYYFEELKDSLTLVDYFAEYERQNWIAIAIQSPKKLFSFFKRRDKEVVSESLKTEYNSLDSVSFYTQITAKEVSAINKLQNRITVKRTDRIFEIETKMPDAKVSAILNKKIIDHLINYVIKYQTDRERRNNKFIESQLIEAEKRYKTAQLNLASFRDNNVGLIWEADKANMQRLQAEFSLASNIYNNLAQQLEQSKLRLEESKPVVAIFQKPILPLSPSEPNTPISAIVFSILGLFIGISFIVFKIVFEFFKQA